MLNFIIPGSNSTDSDQLLIDKGNWANISYSNIVLTERNIQDETLKYMTWN